ncbi:MAG: hypothetical protein ABIJ61_14950, partial [bacterium]
IKPEKAKSIKVKIAKGCEEDNFKKSFTIELNNPEKTRYTIPVELRKVLATQPAELQDSPQPAKKLEKPSTAEGK